MTAEHIRALNGIGFDWGTSKSGIDSIWTVRFQQIREYKAQFGHCRAAKPKLSTWVKTQRRNYKLYQEGKPSLMTAERIRELESIGGCCLPDA